MSNPDIQKIIDILNSFDVNEKKITFVCDAEKMKHVIGYFNSKGVCSATRILTALFFADMISLEESNRTIYGEMYLAHYFKDKDLLMIDGITISESLNDRFQDKENEDIELHEEYNPDFISGSDMNAINKAIEMFDDWSVETYMNVVKTNKYAQIIKKELGDKERMFVRWEPLIADFPDEKKNWLRDFDRAIVY